MKLFKNIKFLILILILSMISFGAFWLFNEPKELSIIEVTEDGNSSLVYFDVNDQKKEQAEHEDVPSRIDDIEQESSIVDTVVELKLTGILYDGDESSAIVEIDGSDYWVKAGERIGKFDILKIEKKRIYLKDDKQNYTLIVGEVVYLSYLGGNLC